HWSLAQALRRAGDAAGAERESRLANDYLSYAREQKRLVQRIKDHPQEASYYVDLARLYLNHREPDRAIPVARDGLAVAPESQPLKELLRQAQEAAGGGGGWRAAAPGAGGGGVERPPSGASPSRLARPPRR